RNLPIKVTRFGNNFFFHLLMIYLGVVERDLERAYTEKRRAAYCQQFGDHPKLKERVRIAINISPVPSKESLVIYPSQNKSRAKVQFRNGSKLEICLNASSNYPGANKNLQAITISAIGS